MVDAACADRLRIQPIPAHAGIGLRDAHFVDLAEQRPQLGWLEAHSENFFGDNSRRHALLASLRAHYPLSLHGVGLSLGSSGALDPVHLQQLQTLVSRYEPWIVSEHLCWAAAPDRRHSNALLPLPYSEEAIHTVCAHIDETQELLGRQIAVENVSTYLEFPGEMTEWAFLAEVARRSGCGILLDINNIYVNARNHGFDPTVYLQAMPQASVVEYHLAGYEDRGHTLIDTHGAAVHEPVWALFQHALTAIGPRPTLIEWDTDIPALPVLLAEMMHAERYLQTHRALAA